MGRLAPDSLKHRVRQVDGHDVEPTAREPDDMTPCPTTQVDKPARRDKPFIENLGIGLEKRVARKISVFLGSKPRGVEILPQGDVHSLGKTPGGWHTVHVHSY